MVKPNCALHALYGVVVVVVFGCLLFDVSAAVGGPVFEEQTLLTSGQGGYHTYRIPAAIRTGTAGTVLFFCEGRKNSSSDLGEVHMLMLRSVDNGRTWSDPQVVWKDTSEPDVTIGNPCPIYDTQTGTVHLGFTRNNKRVFVTSSTDDGVNWATPTEITDDVRPASWKRYWTGPGHGLQLTRGPKAGRLLFPSFHIIDEGDRNVMRSHMVYSDDHGATWQIGQSTAIGPEIDPDEIHMPYVSWLPGTYDWEGSECVAVETVDGRLYLTIRNQPVYQGKKGCAWSDDGGETWLPMGLQNDLPGARCQSSIIRFSDADSGQKNRILWSGITDGSPRQGLTVFLSEDEAQSFPISRVVHPGPSAYSDMAVLPDRSVLLFYEGGSSSTYESIRLARFNLIWLTQDEPIPGDANGDNIVNDEDASILAAHWQQSGENISWGDGDFNGDNIVNDADASILAAHWQETGEGTSPVPEPSTLVTLSGMMVFAGLGVLLRRRR